MSHHSVLPPIHGLLLCDMSGACVSSGRNSVRKYCVNGSITRCNQSGISAHLRSVVRAALAAAVLILATVAFSATVPARADVAAPASHKAHKAHKARDYAAAAARMRMRVWHFAMHQHGKPYIWGGTGPAGFDCSGLVWAAYRAAGIRLPRTTSEMLGSWRLVRIPKWKARRGDLAFFGTGHVELYEWGEWTFGAQNFGTRIGFHEMNYWWHPTMYFRVRM